ncbi:MAG: type IIA DNA topoisomerase subunit B [Kiritimatiellae bacterium]|nr:type IIA DNA topoisomerase subunit B [Kiritimatiellia bacterium]
MKAYDEDAIKHLEGLEHIRLRSGMYIGREGDGSDYMDGIYILLKEVFDNAIDEFISGFGRKIELSVSEKEVSCRDYGRGIPLGKLRECVSELNTGGKFNTDVFQYSVGMNGVGTKAVNALSSRFLARSVRDGKFAQVEFERGKLVSETSGATDERNGTFVSFTPDEEIFKGYAFRRDFVERRVRFSSYLNPGLSINLDGTVFRSENGLLDLLADEAQFEKIYKPIHYRSKDLEFCFTHTNRFGEDYFSFVNGQFTGDGGTHLAAFREGVARGVNEFSPKTKFEPDDVREGMVGAVAVRMQEPKFESQTKNKLVSLEAKDLVPRIKQIVVEELNRNPEAARKLLEKIEDTQKLRKELASVKKAARERSKSVSIRIPQLRDCKLHYDPKRGKGLGTEIFIVEGKSAGGTLTLARDADRQAVFMLRGKPLNTVATKRDVLYKNEELYNLMCALDIGESVDNLRYARVIIATDADVDGLHIRNLMITYFLRFFDRLVREGKVFVLETPLFRVRPQGKRGADQNVYCYNERERDEAVAAIGKSAQITRFKGLGEVNKDEFKEFIGDAMRLVPVDVSQDRHVQDTIEFYMGENSKERKQYILDNLVVDPEDVV